MNLHVIDTELPTEEANDEDPKQDEEELKIHMNINIEGENVLEGLKQLTKSGYATKIHEKILNSIFVAPWN